MESWRPRGAREIPSPPSGADLLWLFAGHRYVAPRPRTGPLVRSPDLLLITRHVRCCSQELLQGRTSRGSRCGRRCRHRHRNASPRRFPVGISAATTRPWPNAMPPARRAASGAPSTAVSRSHPSRASMTVGGLLIPGPRKPPAVRLTAGGFRLPLRGRYGDSAEGGRRTGRAARGLPGAWVRPGVLDGVLAAHVLP